MREREEMFPFKRNFPPVSHMLRNFIIDYTVSKLKGEMKNENQKSKG